MCVRGFASSSYFSIHSFCLETRSPIPTKTAGGYDVKVLISATMFTAAILYSGWIHPLDSGDDSGKPSMEAPGPESGTGSRATCLSPCSGKLAKSHHKAWGHSMDAVNVGVCASSDRDPNSSVNVDTTSCPESSSQNVLVLV